MNRIITFNCRNEEKVKIEYDELEKMEDCFLKNMVIDCQVDKIDLTEDANIIKSILESMRLKKLIFQKDDNLLYMLALCEKWCMPYWLLYNLKDEIEIPEKMRALKLIDSIMKSGVLKCKLCGVGFKEKENTSTSCKSHRHHYDIPNECYVCCGGTEHCRIGYHVADIDMLPYYVNIIRELKNG